LSTFLCCLLSCGTLGCGTLGCGTLGCGTLGCGLLLSGALCFCFFNSCQLALSWGGFYGNHLESPNWAGVLELLTIGLTVSKGKSD
jgi:hypothetical protein